jgi:hypothetical protein
MPILSQDDLREIADVLYGLQTTNADYYLDRADILRKRILDALALCDGAAVVSKLD